MKNLSFLTTKIIKLNRPAGPIQSPRCDISESCVVCCGYVPLYAKNSKDILPSSSLFGIIGFGALPQTPSPHPNTTTTNCTTTTIITTTTKNKLKYLPPPPTIRIIWEIQCLLCAGFLIFPFN